MEGLNVKNRNGFNMNGSGGSCRYYRWMCWN